MTAHYPHKQMINGNVTLGLDPKVGDHAHVLYYSDIHPCTVVKRTKKFVWVQMDNYKLTKGENQTLFPEVLLVIVQTKDHLNTNLLETLKVVSLGLVLEIMVNDVNVEIILLIQQH